MKKKLISMLLCVAMVAAFVSGCGGSGDKQEGSANGGSNGSTAKDTIVYSTDTAPQGVFNPLISDISIDNYVNNVVYASMLTVNDSGELEPYLAESYSVSDDQKVLTFKLRSDVKWHDGEAMTAEDVVFTFTSMAAKEFTGGGGDAVENIVGYKEYNAGSADSVSGIKAVDDQTVEFTFEQAYSPALTKIGTTNILPEHIWGKAAVGEWDNQTDLMKAPIGCGPYKLTEYESGSYVKFESNEDFFLGAPKTKNLVFKVVNADTVQAEFKSGSIDIANVEALAKDDITDLTDTGLKTISYPNFQFVYMGFNLRNTELQSKELRQAFMYAVDRQGIVDNVLEGRGQVVNCPLLPSSWAYPDESKLEQYKYDPEKAKELIKQAGYEDKDGDGFVEDKDGKKLHFDIVCQNNSPKREQTAVIIQEAMKEVGIEIDIDSMEFAAVMEKCVSNHEYDMFMMGNTLDLDPDPFSMWSSTAISNEPGVQGYNIIGYYNEETDKLIAEGQATLDQDKRDAAYEKFAEIVNEDCPELFLFCQNIERVYNQNLQGYQPSTFNEFYNIHNWVIE